MKKFFGFNKLLASVAVLASVMIFQSCLDDDDNDYYRYALPNALVTVKPVADYSFFMQLDDSTTLLPVNMKNSPYGEKEVRELDPLLNINWTFLDKTGTLLSQENKAEFFVLIQATTVLYR